MYTRGPNEDKCCILASSHHTYLPPSTIRACGREVEVEGGGRRGGRELGAGGVWTYFTRRALQVWQPFRDFLWPTLGARMLV